MPTAWLALIPVPASPDSPPPALPSALLSLRTTPRSTLPPGPPPPSPLGLAPPGVRAGLLLVPGERAKPPFPNPAARLTTLAVKPSSAHPANPHPHRPPNPAKSHPVAAIRHTHGGRYPPPPPTHCQTRQKSAPRRLKSFLEKTLIRARDPQFTPTPAARISKSRPVPLSSRLFAVIPASSAGTQHHGQSQRTHATPTSPASRAATSQPSSGHFSLLSRLTPSSPRSPS